MLCRKHGQQGTRHCTLRRQQETEVASLSHVRVRDMTQALACYCRPSTSLSASCCAELFHAGAVQLLTSEVCGIYLRLQPRGLEVLYNDTLQCTTIYDNTYSNNILYNILQYTCRSSVAHHSSASTGRCTHVCPGISRNPEPYKHPHISPYSLCILKAATRTPNHTLIGCGIGVHGLMLKVQGFLDGSFL